MRSLDSSPQIGLPWLRIALLVLFGMFFCRLQAQVISETSPLPDEEKLRRPVLGQVIFGGGFSKPNHSPVRDYMGFYGLLGMTVSRDPGFNLAPDPFQKVNRVQGWTWSASLLMRGMGERRSFSQGLANAHLGRYLLLNRSYHPTTYVKLAAGLQGGFIKLPAISVHSYLLQSFREGNDPQLDEIIVQNKSQAVAQGQVLAELVTLYTFGAERLMTRLRVEYGLPILGDYQVQSDATPSHVVRLNPTMRGYQAMDLTFAVPSQGVEFGVGGFSQLALRTDDGINVERVFCAEMHLGLLFGGLRKAE